MTTTWVALLRGINVGRNKRIAMYDLRELLQSLGYTDVRTHLQSGNALVTAERAALEQRVEAALPLSVRVVVLTADELVAAVAGCPFRERADAQPRQVHVAYLGGTPDPERLAAVCARRGDDELAEGPRALYLSYAGSTVDAPLSKALAATDLGVVVTTRNWATATRLVELSGRAVPEPRAAGR